MGRGGNLTGGPSLPPGAIIGAARADLALKRRKVERQEAPGAPYAFHRRHVAKAVTAAELLELAYEDRDRGLGSGKLNTRVIYGDPAALAAAIVVAQPPQPSGQQGEWDHP
jgi:hypothetical protein